MDRTVNGREHVRFTGQPEKRQPASLRSKRLSVSEKEAGIKKALGKNANHAKLAIRIAVLAVVCIYAAISMITQGSKYLSQQQKMQQLLQRRDELQSELAALEEQEDYIGSSDYIEQAARAKLGWVKDGEIIFKKDE